MITFVLLHYDFILCFRFYSALYKKLFDPKVNNTTHQAMLLNLVYKALLRDTESDRVKIFIKRLLQVLLKHFLHIALLTVHILRWHYILHHVSLVVFFI